MDTSGAKSQLAGITSAIVVMFVLLFLTPVFKNMPQNVQGAIVIAAVTTLFNYSEWFFLWKVSPKKVQAMQLLLSLRVTSPPPCWWSSCPRSCCCIAAFSTLQGFSG